MLDFFYASGWSLRSNLVYFDSGCTEDQMPPGVPLDVEVKNLQTNSLFRDMEINLVAFERLVAKGEIIQAEVKRVYLMFHHLNFGDKTGFSSDGSAVPNLGSERSANDCYERRVLDAVQFSNSGGRPILRYVNCVDRKPVLTRKSFSSGLFLLQMRGCPTMNFS